MDYDGNMKVVGIIAEYNPFHNGHKYHIEQARALTGADFVVVVMSGDYTQRGIPAIYEKSLRAKVALLCGADLVLEMPVFGAISASADFAQCGVSLLSHSGVVDYLCFGSESGNLDILSEHAGRMESESEEISLMIKNGLKEGMTWPQARAHAYGDVPDAPNDILAVEYLRVLIKLHSDIIPIMVKRTDPGYHSEDASGMFASATAARKAILAHDEETLRRILPDESFAVFSHDDNLCESFAAVTFDDFSAILNYRLLTVASDELHAVSGMPADLADKLFKNRLNYKKAAEMTAEIKDRQYTYTRINRCLMNLILGITKSDSVSFKAAQSAPWLRILGFRREAEPLLSALKKNADIPIIPKTADAEKLLPASVLPLWKKQLETSELYRMTAELKSGRPMKNEFTREIVIV